MIAGLRFCGDVAEECSSDDCTLLEGIGAAIPSAAGLGGPAGMLGKLAAKIRQRLAICRQKQPSAAMACSRAGATSAGHEYVRSLIRAHVYMLGSTVVSDGHLGWYQGWVLLLHAAMCSKTQAKRANVVQKAAIRVDAHRAGMALHGQRRLP